MTPRTLRGYTNARSVRVMKITASEFRANVMGVLDDVLDKGTIVEVRRRGRTIRIVADRPTRKLDRLVARPDFIVGDPDSLVHVDWSSHWTS